MEIDKFSRRILLTFKLDIDRIFNKLTRDLDEIIHIFALKRTREHFNSVFQNKYSDATVAELKYCEEEVIIGIHQFYDKIDDLKWYLDYTEDMPGSVELTMKRYINELRPLYEMVTLYITAQLGFSDENDKVA